MENYVISKISPNTTGDVLLSDLTGTAAITLYDKSNNTITSQQIIGTGMKLKVGNTEYQMVVIGDLNGDGKVTITDLYKIKQHIVGIETLKSVYLIAGNIKNSGDKITVTDMLMVKETIIGKRNL